MLRSVNSDEISDQDEENSSVEDEHSALPAEERSKSDIGGISASLVECLGEKAGGDIVVSREADQSL